MSMNPGATTSPCASMRRVAGASASRPIAAIRPLRIPTSAAYQGEPVPSTTRPLTMTTSNGGDVWVWETAVITARRRPSAAARIGYRSFCSVLVRDAPPKMY